MTTTPIKTTIPAAENNSYLDLLAKAGPVGESPDLTDCICTLSCDGHAVTNPGKIDQCVIMCFGEKDDCEKVLYILT